MVTAEMEELLGAGGDASLLMRSIDWAATPLGAISAWSEALRTTVGLMLRNHFPLSLWWGPRLVQLYDDAYRPMLGNKHPGAMAQPVSDCFRETWDVVGPLTEAPFRGEPAMASEDLFLLLDRKGFLEEAHFKVTYSPVPDKTAGATGVGGALGTCAETTKQVYGERQRRTLRELEARTADAKTAEEASTSAAATPADNAWDVPFALLYLVDSTGKIARRVAAVGFGGQSSAVAPASIDLTDDAASVAWPLSSLPRGETRVFEGLDARLGALPRGRWSVAPHTAVALSLVSSGQPRPHGILICGASPHRALDDHYRGFFELVAAQIVAAIRNALVHQEQCRRVEALASVDRARTAFFNRVSHEFRTPLTLMLGPLEDALASPECALHGEDLAVAYRSAHRLLKLVNTLLDLLKPLALEALSGAVVGVRRRRCASGVEDSGQVVHDHGR